MYFYLTWKFSSGILMTWSWKMQSTLPFWLWKRGKFIQVFRYLENWYFSWSTDQSCHLNILNPIITNSALTWSADSKVRSQERTLKLESLMRSEYSSMPLHHCISGSSVDVNAQGPGFFKEAGMISGNVIIVEFVHENCFPPLVVVLLPLSKSIYCSQPLEWCLLS